MYLKCQSFSIEIEIKVRTVKTSTAPGLLQYCAPGQPFSVRTQDQDTLQDACGRCFSPQVIVLLLAHEVQDTQTRKCYYNCVSYKLTQTHYCLYTKHWMSVTMVQLSLKLLATSLLSSQHCTGILNLFYLKSPANACSTKVWALFSGILADYKTK